MRSLRAMAMVAFALVAATPVYSQYMYLDADEDGKSTTSDTCALQGIGHVDIWLQTNTNRNGSPAAVARWNEAPTLFSYEVVIRAEGGTVEWGEYLNQMKGMTDSFGRFESTTEVYCGFGGLSTLPPGRYLLGRLEYRVQAGSPSLAIASRSDLGPGLRTSFGSDISGRDGDHTLKFDPECRSTDYGDWSDVDGLATAEASAAPALAATTAPKEQFQVSVTPNPSNPGALISLVTTKVGPATVRVFDVAGRLVSTLVDSAVLPAGRHEIAFPGSHRARGQVPSGIYLVRVDAAEGTRVLRLVVLK